MTSLVDRANVCKSLVGLLQGIQGRRTTIELRNENAVVGTVEIVDPKMNITLKNAVFRTLDGEETEFEKFFIRGIQIRFVHIPDDVDMKATVTKRIEQEQKIAKRGKFEKKTKKQTYAKKVNQKYEETKRALGMDQK